MKTKLSILIIFTSIFGFSQETVLSSGKEASGVGGMVNYSIGQVAYISANGAVGTASQGVQQPFEIYILGSSEVLPNVKLSYVYPNPTTAFVALKIVYYNNEKLQYVLNAFNGKKLDSKPITSEEILIDMQNYANGIYILQIIYQSKTIKTFKIVKN
jgi:hypothetical protein